MTKDKIKNLLDNYKLEHDFYNEKVKEIEKISESHTKTIRILKEFNQDKNNESVENLISDYIKELIQHETVLTQIKEHLYEIEAMIEKVSQPYKTVLYYRYIIGDSIEQIAERMNYSVQRIYQLHDLGLKLLTEKEEAV